MSLSLLERSNVLACLCTIAGASLIGSFASAQGRYVDGPYGYGGGYHASTVQEGAQRGFADVVRSAGQYNLDTAQAASTAQDAVSKYYDNRAKGTDTYFQMRQANSQYRKAEEIPPLSSEQLYRIAAEQAPKPLTASHLDPLTGQIDWPLVLQGDEYAQSRADLEALFASRAQGGSSQEVFHIQQAANSMLAQLKANIRDYPANEYLQSRKFLERLAYSARAPNL